MPIDLPRLTRLFDNRRPLLGENDKGCHLWPANQLAKGGYALLRYRQDGVIKKIRAYRLAYMIRHGLTEFPEGMEILHSCDEPRCVNADHLSLGTRLQNEQDKVSKGRSVKGEDRSRSGLSNELAQQLLNRYRDGESLRLLCLELDIPYKTGEAIVGRRRWKYLK